MNNLFQQEVAVDIQRRIDKLSPQTKGLWGKMSVAQMVAHCQVPLQVALGRKELKRGLFGVLFGKIAKKQMLKETPFKKNLPTDPSFIIRYQPDFNHEKQQLVLLVQSFATANIGEIEARPHPFFGKMTEDEWGRLMWKHLDHHLQQFGV